MTTGKPRSLTGRVAGDPVATCAQLQQAAPIGTVLVAEPTGRATERPISYGPASLLRPCPAGQDRARHLARYHDKPSSLASLALQAGQQA